MPPQPLNLIETILEEDDYIVRREPVADASEVTQLLVPVSEDAEERIYLLEILVLNELESLVELPEPVPETDASDRVLLLQFFSAFPFEVDDVSIPRLLQYLQLVNEVIPFGALVVNRLSHRLLYRYVLPISEEQPLSPGIVREVIGFYEMLVAGQATTLWQLASGQITDEQAMQRLGEQGLFATPAAAES